MNPWLYIIGSYVVMAIGIFIYNFFDPCDTDNEDHVMCRTFLFLLSPLAVPLILCVILPLFIAFGVAALIVAGICHSSSYLINLPTSIKQDIMDKIRQEEKEEKE